MGLKDEFDKKTIGMNIKYNEMRRESNNQSVELMAGVASFFRVLPSAIVKFAKGIKDKEDPEAVFYDVMDDYKEINDGMKEKIGKFWQGTIKQPNDYADGIKKDENNHNPKGPVVYANSNFKEQKESFEKAQTKNFIDSLNPDNKKYDQASRIPREAIKVQPQKAIEEKTR